MVEEARIPQEEVGAQQTSKICRLPTSLDAMAEWLCAALQMRIMWVRFLLASLEGWQNGNASEC